MNRARFALAWLRWFFETPPHFAYRQWAAEWSAREPKRSDFR